MSSGSTPRLRIPYPVLTDPDAFPADIEAIANFCDTNFIPYAQQATAPVAPVGGTLWWCTDNTNSAYGMNFFDGATWRAISLGAISRGTTAPGSPYAGQLWNDTTNVNNALNVYNGSAWVPLIPTTVTYGLALVSSSAGLVYGVPTDTSKLPFTGGTLTGPLILSADPTVPLGAATKQYVDAETTRAEAAEGALIPKANNNATLTAPLEGAYISAVAPSGIINLYASANPTSVLMTTAATANFSFNIAASSTATLNSLMAIGQEITLTVKITQGATAYYCTGISIDGVAQTANWQGGMAPSFGYASGIDAYFVNITKTAASTYTVLAGLTQF